LDHERGLTDRDGHGSFSKAVVASGLVAEDLVISGVVSVERERFRFGGQWYQQKMSIQNS